MFAELGQQQSNIHSEVDEENLLSMSAVAARNKGKARERPRYWTNGDGALNVVG